MNQIYQQKTRSGEQKDESNDDINKNAVFIKNDTVFDIEVSALLIVGQSPSINCSGREHCPQDEENGGRNSHWVA
ncbi:MAG TPA: hypothetical protein PLA50_02210 [Bacteroidia bacterium]|nr:hypothetical protein [Bacteroidia bacterium]